VRRYECKSVSLTRRRVCLRAQDLDRLQKAMIPEGCAPVVELRLPQLNVNGMRSVTVTDCKPADYKPPAVRACRRLDHPVSHALLRSGAQKVQKSCWGWNFYRQCKKTVITAQGELRWDNRRARWCQDVTTKVLWLGAPRCLMLDSPVCVRASLLGRRCPRAPR
jgi:hypothetical protein